MEVLTPPLLLRAQILEVFGLGVGMVLRLGRGASIMGQ